MSPTMIADLIRNDREHLADNICEIMVKLPTIQDAMPEVQARIMRDFCDKIQELSQKSN